MTFTHQPLAWQDSFNTGLQEIDDQHMILVHTLNEAGAKLAHHASKELLQQITQDLLSYALYHFDTEEALMLAYDYEHGDNAAMQKHMGQHRAFSAKVVAVRDTLKAGGDVAPGDVLSFLNTWLVEHILNTDKQLAAFVIACRNGGAGSGGAA